MAHMYELAGELSQLDRILRLDHVHGDPFHPVFLQFQIHQGQSQFGAVDMCRRLL